jgi:hypothetical protein
MLPTWNDSPPADELSELSSAWFVNKYNGRPSTVKRNGGVSCRGIRFGLTPIIRKENKGGKEEGYLVPYDHNPR